MRWGQQRARLQEDAPRGLDDPRRQPLDRLVDAGGRAVGISGKDGGLVMASKVKGSPMVSSSSPRICSPGSADSSPGQAVTDLSQDHLNAVMQGTMRLRQRPGPRNALGDIKFVFPNHSNIYLHHTPSTQLFARERRDFSHGCIRVEDPEGLAGWILRGEAGWTPRAVRAATRGSRTVEVPVSRPITVLIGYFTAAGWGEGGFTFREDVYGQDAALATALREEASRRGAEAP
mgnify:CR=1 FL=1